MDARYLTLGPAAAQVIDAPLIVKLHMINGMTVFLLLSFTRLVNIWSVLIWYLARRTPDQLQRHERYGVPLESSKEKA